MLLALLASAAEMLTLLDLEVVLKLLVYAGLEMVQMDVFVLKAAELVVAPVELMEVAADIAALEL